ncbi:uncharacterized protein LOC121984078 [Zingiber officinale]|uniref:Uncharacterized protein n=1 Tax=Zingiber officinale TaxID=94328 RepID=A0A8J5G8U9_ZINOF|nr:uncharacterized protein LOC121984078 [Zingiber officinale]KAG6502758.1 hypothetical protein ZIOFF_035046 [Zingiber officinale]
MGRSAARSRIPETGAPAVGSHEATTPPPLEILPKRARRIRHRIKNLPFLVERRSRPSTPLVRWQLHDAAGMAPELAVLERTGECGAAGVFSARKLAAALWHLHVVEVVDGRLGGSGPRLGFEPNSRQLHSLKVASHDRTDLHASISYEHVGPTSPSVNVTLRTLEESSTHLGYALEKATKWDDEFVRSTMAVHQNHGQLKVFKDRRKTASAISFLQAELEQAHYCINRLENEKQTTKKKVDHIMRKLVEEKASWKSKEHHKVRNAIESIKYDRDRERKRHKRIEIMNSELVNELAQAKLSANQHLQDYEKERKAREHIEEVCEELVKQMGDDKVEIETLTKESMKIREELEEERRMLQMAEVWREERVHLKLVDAKITLEEKHAELNKLQADLDTFLRMHSGTNADVSVLKEAEMLRDAVSLMKFNAVEFHYQPPPSSGDIFSVFEELQPGEETNAKGIEQCSGYKPASTHACNTHSASPDTDIFLEDPMNIYASGTLDGDKDTENDRLEIMSYGEGQGSCTSPGSDPSANGIHEESHASASGSSEVCSRTTRQSRNKMLSIGKLWRSSFVSNSNNKKTQVETNRKILNARMLNATLSPDMDSGEVDPSSPSVGMQRSCDSTNSCISRGMQGCSDLPGETKDHSLKKKLLEARVKSPRFQLRHVLKH